jgi:hypothetical protein
MKTRAIAVCLTVGLLTTACASVPTGPSVMVLPGTGKNFEQFQVDDAVCRQWAAQQTGTTTEKASTNTAVTGAAVGTRLGAAAGAAIGAAAGSPGTGAAAGAGIGLLGGTAVGAGNASTAYGSVQRRYDASYMQCMYAKGNQIPVSRGYQPAYSAPPASTAPRAVSTPPPPPPPPPAGTPQPPPGSPPPPPPGPTR